MTGSAAVQRLIDGTDLKLFLLLDPRTAAGAHPYCVVMTDAAWRPLAVLVSGAPGSGKTTLAAELADRLQLPHVNRDQLWSGLRFTVNRGAPRSVGGRGIAAEYGVMEHLLALGVSLVNDGTMYVGEFESHVRRLTDLAEVVNVHCRATACIERDQQRFAARGGTAAELESRRERLASIQHLVVEPLELGCRLVEVWTDDGYEPGLDAIVDDLTSTAATPSS